MGKIPENRRTVLASRVRTQNIDTAGRVGRSFAAASEQVGQQLVQMERVQENDYMNQKSLELENTAKELFEEHKQTYSGDPLNKNGEYQKELDKRTEELLKDAPNDRVRRRMRVVTNSLSETMRFHNKKWEVDQTRMNVGKSTSDALQEIEIDALRLGDPSTINKVEQKGWQFLDNLRRVAPKEVVDQTITDFKTNVAYNSFKGQISSGNYDEAERLLNSKEYDEYLGADGIIKVQREIDSARRTATAQAQNLEKLKYTDPWKYLQKTGLTSGNVPLDINSAESFRQRAQFVEQTRKQHGFEVPLMPEEEKLKFIQFIDGEEAGTPEERVDKLQSLAEQMEPEIWSDFSDQVFEKSKEMGAAMALAPDSPAVSREILIGRKLLESDTIQLGKGTNEADIKLNFEEQVENSIPDPELRDSLFYAVRAYAASTAYRNKKSVIESDDINEAISGIFGEPVTVNGNKTLSFKVNGEIVSDLEDFYENLEEKEIRKVHKDFPRDASGNFIDIDDLNDDFSLEVAGDGRYFLYKDASGGRRTYAVDKNGLRFELRLKEVYERSSTSGITRRVSSSLEGGAF